MIRGHGLYWHEKGIAIPPSEETFESKIEREARIAKFVADLVVGILAGGMLLAWVLIF